MVKPRPVNGARHPPRPMRPTFGRVDIGGYELAWMCQGEGSPTIIAEAGYDSAGTSTYLRVDGADVQPSAASARTTERARGRAILARRVCTSRVSRGEGTARHAGGCGDRSSVRRRGSFVRRVHRPAVRGHIRSETAGLVLIDSSHEDEIDPYRRYYGDSPEGDWVDGGDLIDIDATGRALRATARDYGDMPLADRQGRSPTRTSSAVALWDRTQADLATLSSNSVLVQARGRALRDERRSEGAARCDPRRGVERSHGTNRCQRVLVSWRARMDAAHESRCCPPISAGSDLSWR